MRINKKNVILTICLASAAAFWLGCAIAGNLASETPSEKVTPAEFNLADTEGKIVILVNQPGWIKAPMDLRTSLTKAINLALEEKAGIKKDRLIEYDDVLNARRSLPEGKKDEPNEIAAKLGAQYVLDVQIMDFDLSTFAEKDFFNGIMTTKSCLLDAKDKKLWPEDEAYRSITVEIEDEKGTMETSVAKMSAATAYCITRYFYDCKTVRFRVPEEHKELDTYDF